MARASPDLNSHSAFTLLELLLVIAIIALLAALLLPALSVAQAKGRQVGCLNNLKQLILSAQMYAADNAGKLAENLPMNVAGATNSWVLGNMANKSDATNQYLIQQGKFFPYANRVDLYRCPADSSRTNGVPRVRSFSMNGWMGSRYMEVPGESEGFRTFLRESELTLAGPSRLWMLIDEHEASIDDGWFLVTMDDRRPFASFPATRHGRGYGLNFADGHVEVYHLRDPNSSLIGMAGAQFSAQNSDWLRLKQITTLR